MRSYELRPATSKVARQGFQQLPWGGTNTEVRADVDAWFSEFGPVTDAAIDLGRIATAAYLADRLSRRADSLSRSLSIHVQLLDPAPWKPALPKVVQLLEWLSGDAWVVSVSKATGAASAPTPLALADVTPPAAVALFSGGLDSFAGAALDAAPTLYLSHTDNNPTVSKSQIDSWRWLTEHGRSGEAIRVHLSESAKKQEKTTRTRALLFYALAVAAADARGIAEVEVPENGFTGLNLALSADRGGVMSTRSTHPWTVHLIGELLESVGLTLSVTNTYSMATKGELVKAAAAALPQFAEGIAATLSCAKLDGRVYKGGNPNLGCGLCVACLTRRSSILAAGISDPTPYLATTLTGGSLDQLKSRRARDIEAVRRRSGMAVDEFTLLEGGRYPDSYDLTAAADLCRRGFAELKAMVATL